MDQEEQTDCVFAKRGGDRECFFDVVCRQRVELSVRIQVKSLPQVIWRIRRGDGIWIGDVLEVVDGPNWPFLESP